MYNANKPSADELPSSAQLLRSTLIAIIAAAALLVTTVLPSEYGIDPTGAGRLLGLTEMGEIKIQLAEEAEAERLLAAETEASETPQTETPLPPQVEAAAPAPEQTAKAEPTPTIQETEGPEELAATAIDAAPQPTEPAPPPKSDEVSITLSPGQGAEIKLVMKSGAQARFEWTANGSVLNHDTHGSGGGQRITYEKGRGVPGGEGVLEAAFDGNHGWFWRNRTDANVTMTLRTEGDYIEMKRVL